MLVFFDEQVGQLEMVTNLSSSLVVWWTSSFSLMKRDCPINIFINVILPLEAAISQLKRDIQRGFFIVAKYEKLICIVMV